MIEALAGIDEQLFSLLNGRWHTAWLDAIMPWWRDRYTWLPLYILLTLWILWRFRKQGIYLLLGMLLSVGISDTISHRLIKAQVQRERPCRAELRQQARVLVPCGGGYSFTSNHAANHTALAVFLCLTVFRRKKWWSLAWLAWALSIGYGQVYVGVHYPFDVLAGSLLGILISIGVFQILRKYVSLQKITA